MEGNSWRRKKGKHMETPNIFWRRRKTEKEKEEYSVKQNIFLAEEKQNEEGKGGKYLEKENIFWRRRRRMEKVKEENCCRRDGQGGWTLVVL